MYYSVTNYILTYIHTNKQTYIQRNIHTHIYTFHGTMSVSQRQQDVEEVTKYYKHFTKTVL
jgi:hypothetical protein